MIKLFQYRDETNYSTILNQQWRVIKDNFLVDLDKVQTYYRHSSRRVKSNNQLTRIIKHLNIKTSLSIYTFLEVVDATYKFSIKTQGVSSSIHQGKLIEGLIKNNDTSVVIDANFEINLFNIKKIWKTQIPLRPIRTDSQDINLAHPTDMLLESSLTVYELDTRLMMVMYKYWVEDQIKNDGSTDPSSFVYNYVITNSIPIFLDLSIINRFLSPSIEKIPFIKVHPFVIRDQTTALNNTLRYMQKKLKKRNTYYEELLANIPTVYSKDSFSLIQDKESFINRQNIWSHFIARGDLLIKLIYFLGPKGVDKNHKHFLDLYLYMLKLHSSKMMSFIDFKDFTDDVSLTYDFLKELSKKRKL